jgi:hypothetical protein
MKGSMEPPKELPPWRKQPLATIEKNPVDPMDKQIAMIKCMPTKKLLKHYEYLRTSETCKHIIHG